MSSAKTWLITGASSGLGKALALAALKAGHTTIGTTRDVEKAKHDNLDLTTGGIVWLGLDPGHADAEEQFAECVEKYDIDVLVNNAGYAMIGGVEDTSEDEVRAQMEVNFYGPLRTVRAVLPKMRAKGSGNIVLISSGAGFIARPARGVYSASKFAIEAIHESLSHEVESFGIKVLIVEPGAFRTPFASRIVTPRKHAANGGFSEAYHDTAVEQLVKGTSSMASMPDWVKGDPDKAAKAILDAVHNGHEYLRLPLGPDCAQALEMKIGELQRDLDATRGVAMSTDID